MAEQELYAGADSMEIVRDAHAYFSNKQMEWQSANDAISDLDSVHRTGVEAMGLLVVGHLTGAGAAVRRKEEGALPPGANWDHLSYSFHDVYCKLYQTDIEIP